MFLGLKASNLSIATRIYQSTLHRFILLYRNSKDGQPPTLQDIFTPSIRTDPHDQRTSITNRYSMSSIMRSQPRTFPKTSSSTPLKRFTSANGVPHKTLTRRTRILHLLHVRPSSSLAKDRVTKPYIQVIRLFEEPTT